MSVRRVVITAFAELLVLVGILVGVGAGYAYTDSGGSRGVGVLVGIGSALGAWLAAALLGLAIEMADSLRVLAGRSPGPPS
ncbi:MAG: hypothetical protein ACXVRK_10380 [Gaiellaceae bacterium]